MPAGAAWRPRRAPNAQRRRFHSSNVSGVATGRRHGVPSACGHLRARSPVGERGGELEHVPTGEAQIVSAERVVVEPRSHAVVRRTPSPRAPAVAFRIAEIDAPPLAVDDDRVLCERAAEASKRRERLEHEVLENALAFSVPGTRRAEHRRDLLRAASRGSARAVRPSVHAIRASSIRRRSAVVDHAAEHRRRRVATKGRRSSRSAPTRPGCHPSVRRVDPQAARCGACATPATRGRRSIHRRDLECRRTRERQAPTAAQQSRATRTRVCPGGQDGREDASVRTTPARRATT